MLDIFALIVLIVLLAAAVAIWVILGMLPRSHRTIEEPPPSGCDQRLRLVRRVDHGAALPAGIHLGVHSPHAGAS